MARFARYIGIDYSGAGRPDQRISGLRCFESSQGTPAQEVLDGHRLWSRQGLHACLAEWIFGQEPVLIGIDHGFSFPEAYFEAHGLGTWFEALEDFVAHWPCDQHTVQSLRNDPVAMRRQGSARWRRECEKLARAKSVFHFDVPGSVAKSTHAGLPWLLKLKLQGRERLHVWPFDGLEPMPGATVILEAYPALWSSQVKGLMPATLGPDQRDACVVAESLQRADASGLLEAWLLDPKARLGHEQLGREGWILGVREPRFGSVRGQAPTL